MSSGFERAYARLMDRKRKPVRAVRPRVLAALAGGEEMDITAIALKAGVHYANTQKALSRLWSQGMVSRRDTGASRVSGLPRVMYYLKPEVKP